MTDSSGLADLRDQIVRLQQQWRDQASELESIARADAGCDGSGWEVEVEMKREHADALDPILTLVRSIVEAWHGQETETENGKKR
jgi:hypothetical protein